ncbi:phage tail domain-containing protein [Emticicia agri]|uniref:Siphovirus-type tail component RIFT-related domain-containing protein n=1 Tax=Emticicia agri TaxID=2492393 RepID=A0A4V1ZCR5_9BACT|nr:phage tail domain-containing protein [Emticicia agri]RYU93580.1 hypothetical protein EWM59_21270 [Emticicia agri]
MPEQILDELSGTESTLSYLIDGKNFLSEYGVYVSASGGMQDAPSLKEPQTVNWPGSHGTVVDLSAPRYNNREIELECFIKASGKMDFFTKVRAFQQAFQKPELRKLELRIIENKPLIYMVYLADSITIEKQWHSEEMFGTFTLKLIEPSPVKRLLVRTGNTVSIQFASANPIDIYWGDGQKTLNVFGSDVNKTHNYSISGTYYILLCGVIEEISDFIAADTQTIWTKY